MSGTLHLRRVTVLSSATVNTARGSRDAPGGQELGLSSQSQSSSATVMQIPWRGKKGIWWGGGGIYRQPERGCQESDFRRSRAIQEKVRFRVREKVSES